MIKIYNEQWVNYGRWVQPTLSGCFWSVWSDTKSIDEFFGKNFVSNILFLDGNILLKVKDEKKLKKLLSNWSSSSVKTESIIKLFNDVNNKYIKNHLSLLNRKELSAKEHIKELFATYNEVVGMWTFCVVMGDFLQEYILTKKIIEDEGELQVIVDQIRKGTWLEDQSKEINIFIKRIKKIYPRIKSMDINRKLLEKNKPLFKSIQNHVNKFLWFGTHHWMGDAYTMSRCIGSIKQNFDKLRIAKFTKKYSKIHPMVKFFAELVYWRTHHAEVAAKVVFFSRPILTKYAMQWGLAYDKLIYLSHEEILEYLKGNNKKVKLPKDYNLRKKMYGCYVDDRKKMRIITGKEIARLLRIVNIKINNNVKEIKGTVASAGNKITGKVAIIISPDDFPNFKKGKILVAPETTPDFVPYMKIASAIVTDRGGITSHAAIVSRELKIPCITGTEIATKVLKNNDKVEVDTKTGIVKKI